MKKTRKNQFKIPNIDPSKIVIKQNVPSNKKEQIIKKLNTLQHELENIIKQNTNKDNLREGYKGRELQYEKLQTDINRIKFNIDKYNDKFNQISDDDFKDFMKDIQLNLEKIEGFRHNRTRMPRIYSQGLPSGPKILGKQGKFIKQIAGKHRTRKNRK